MKNQRNLGQLTTSALGLGCMGMSEFYGKTDSEQATQVIHTAYQQGVRLFDTADCYHFGNNEKLLGESIKPYRNKVIIASKFGILRDANNPQYRGLNGSADYVRQSCDASLRRLGTDYIDLYYLHRVDPKVPIEETVGAMADLVKAGKVRYLGLSEAGAKTIQRAHAVHPITAVQSEYSLGTREVEDNGVLAITQQLNIGFVAYSPLCRALLTNDFSATALADNDFRRNMPRFQGDNWQQNQQIVNQLAAIAKQKKCTLAQLSLAWLLAQGDNIVPIPGTKRLSYLQENIAALQVELMPNELAELSALTKQQQLQGQRYPDAIIADHNLNG